MNSSRNGATRRVSPIGVPIPKRRPPRTTVRIVLQFLLLAGALAFAGLAPTTATLIAASLILAGSTVAQQIVPSLPEESPETPQ